MQAVDRLLPERRGADQLDGGFDRRDRHKGPVERDQNSREDERKRPAVGRPAGNSRVEA